MSEVVTDADLKAAAEDWIKVQEYEWRTRHRLNRLLSHRSEKSVMVDDVVVERRGSALDATLKLTRHLKVG